MSAASIHLARFKPRQAGRMLRRREAFGRAPGLVAGRLFMLAELDLVAGGTPVPTRWGLLCGWEDAAARDAFRADVFSTGADETWSASLETVRVVQGDLHGWKPSAEGVERLARDEPLAVMTYAKLRNRHLPAFTLHNRRIVRDMAPNPGLAMMVGLIDHPMTRATFSLWRSQGDVVRFAYGADAIHNPIQRRALDTPWGDDWFFARWRIQATSGSWAGRDPLNGASAPPARSAA